jgi:APA family basic amino acid/polyamine antiporter
VFHSANDLYNFQVSGPIMEHRRSETAHDAKQAPRDLKKPLGFFALLTLGINGTIGVGIFFAPTEVAAAAPGLAGSLVYLLAAAALLPVAFVYGFLGRRFAEDGGPYVWARLAFGADAAFFLGFLTYVSSLLSAAAVATGLSHHLESTFGTLFLPSGKDWALLCVAALSLAVSAGLRLSSLAWSTLTVLKLVPLLLLTLLGGFALVSGQTTPVPAESGSLELGRALLLVVFALQGFEVVPVLAGSTHASRGMALATIGSFVVCALFYAVLHALCVLALPDLAKQDTPLVAAAGALGGGLAARIVSVGQMISALGIAFGQYTITPRYLSTLGRRDGLGEWLGREDSRRVPQRALALTVLAVSVLVLSEELSGLFALSSLAVLAQYAVATFSLAVLAARGHEGMARKQMFWALPSLFGIVLVARGAEASELGAAFLVLVLGALLRGARRLLPK